MAEIRNAVSFCLGARGEDDAVNGASEEAAGPVGEEVAYVY